MLLAAQCHIGTKNLTKRMSPYAFRQRADGIHLLNIGKTWEKLIFAARIIAAIENVSLVENAADATTTDGCRSMFI